MSEKRDAASTHCRLSEQFRTFSDACPTLPEISVVFKHPKHALVTAVLQPWQLTITTSYTQATDRLYIHTHARANKLTPRHSHYGQQPRHRSSSHRESAPAAEASRGFDENEVVDDAGGVDSLPRPRCDRPPAAARLPASMKPLCRY